MSQSKATPRPWFLKGDTAICVPEWGSDTEDGVIKIADVKKTYYRADKSPPIKEYKANAKLIVRAVNYHDELITMLYKVLNFTDDVTLEKNRVIRSLHAEIEDLLHRARGES